ncbi:hypothetical protein, partial [Treponema socranskii]|uniref:hypothetical protein n=1 Tax=Treponema socranskii TaxID=53419 RepID=UPI003D907658
PPFFKTFFSTAPHPLPPVLAPHHSFHTNLRRIRLESSAQGIYTQTASARMKPPFENLLIINIVFRPFHHRFYDLFPIRHKPLRTLRNDIRSLR